MQGDMKIKVPKAGYFLKTLTVNGKKIYEKIVKKRYEPKEKL